MKLRRLPSQLKLMSQLRHYPAQRRSGQISIDTAPTYIVGCAHSGTSILLAILDAHSRIYGVPYETRMFPRPFTRHWMPKYFDMLAISNGKRRWVEKTPTHIRFIDDILNFNAESKVLLILRDGRDVACSIQDRKGSLQVGIDRWVSDNRLGQEYWNHERVHVLRYEDIITDFVDTISQTLSFMGEEYQEICAHYHEKEKHYYAENTKRPDSVQGKHHRQYRNWQINQPIFDGRGKWKRMSEQERELVNRTAGEMLIEYGYLENLDW